MKEKKGFFKRNPRTTLIIFNLIIFFFIFLVFEVSLRVFAPSWLEYRMKSLMTGELKDFGSDASWPITKKDGAFHCFTPNSHFKMYAFEYENEVNINALGGRKTGKSEILDTSSLIPMTGDSFVFGVGVNDSSTVVAHLRSKTGLNFLNLGVTGTGLHFQRKLIEKRYHELKAPPVVVFGFFLGNDFSDILAERSKDKEERAAPAELKKTVVNTSNPSSETFLWKVNYFVNQNALAKRLYSLQYVKVKLLALRNAGEGKVMRPIFYMMDKENTAYHALVREALDKEMEALSKEPFRSIIVIFPDRKQVNSELRRDVSKYYSVDESKLDPGLPNKLLIEALEKHNIPYIDGTSCLKSYVNKGTLYYTQDNHLTPFGQGVFTECVVDKLSKTITSINFHVRRNPAGAEAALKISKPFYK